MRLELLYNPRFLCERLAELSRECRRHAKLRGTVAEHLTSGHIDSLELLELIRPLNPQVILDIGAFTGTWTLLAKALYPAAQIHAFEPLESHCAEFVAATRELKAVSLHRHALGSARANVTMNVVDRSDASSLLPVSAECSRYYVLNGEREVTVPVERLDDVFGTKGIPQPDVLKLDIQGYELEALRGSEVTLRDVRVVLSEVSFVELYKGQCLFHDLAAFLAQRGFHLFALGNQTTLGKPLLQTDALFIADAVRPQLI